LSEANRRSKRVQHDREYKINAMFVMPNSFRHLKKYQQQINLNIPLWHEEVTTTIGCIS